MNLDDRHTAPPTVGPSTVRRVHGRPGHTASRLTRRRRLAAQAKPSDQAQAIATGSSTTLAEWHSMTEPEHVLAWAQLRIWVSWLVGRYRLTLEDRLPACWPQHPELIEELWALRAWRAEAYGPDGTGQATVYWHQALITFLTHVSTWWAAGCRAGHANLPAAIQHECQRMWASADPLAGIPQALRPTASVPSDPTTEPGVISMPGLNVLTSTEMQALTDAGLAHPQHETIAAFAYYDGSWWAHASKQNHNPAAPKDGDNEDTVWFRADDVDLACDHSFYPQRMPRPESQRSRSPGSCRSRDSGLSPKRICNHPGLTAGLGVGDCDLRVIPTLIGHARGFTGSLPRTSNTRRSSTIRAQHCRDAPGYGACMSEIPGTCAARPQSPAHASTAAYLPPPRRGRRVRWLASTAAAVVVGAAACTTSARPAPGAGAGAGASWNPKLPTCAHLAALLPGKPPLAQTYRSDGAASAAGNPPTGVDSLICSYGQAAAVSVDIFADSKYDPTTMSQYEPERPYRDGKVHDGPARAQSLFALDTRGMTALSPTQAYGNAGYNGNDCATTVVDRNVLVTVAFTGRGTTPQQRTANCRQDGTAPTAAVLHGIG